MEQHLYLDSHLQGHYIALYHSFRNFPNRVSSWPFAEERYCNVEGCQSRLGALTRKIRSFTWNCQRGEGLFCFLCVEDNGRVQHESSNSKQGKSE